MPGTTSRVVSVESHGNHPIQNERAGSAGKAARFFTLMKGGTKVGVGATLLLCLVESLDLAFQRPSALRGLSASLTFAAYYSLCLVSGAMIGALVGLMGGLASVVTAQISKSLARGGEARFAQRVIAGTVVCASSAFLLYQQPHVFGYALGVIREAEKVPYLTNVLLSFERFHAYLMIAIILLGCAVLWKVSRLCSSLSLWLRATWLLLLVAAIGIVYAIDSRVEVQLYEPSLHRTMFLLALALSFALAASLSASSPSLRRLLTRLPPIASASLALLLASTLAFTFARFDDNHALKSLLFYRTTQAKQHFKLATWALDFDRDGYSGLLGGGDSDDARGDINPGEAEVVGDGVDNNCVGGDLTGEAVAEWGRQRDSLRAPANPAASRFNLVFIFIDALRPDHLSAYGYERDTSPNLDKLASRSSLFENAFTPSPYTYEALPKFMQSSHWDAHLETWTEALARNGYDAILFPRRTATLLRHVKGMGRVILEGTRGLKETIDQAIAELGRAPGGKPFCAYIYIADPHMPYLHREGFSFGTSLVDRYDGEIAYTDFHLGRLFAWMGESGRMDDTMVVIMSDHGESLGERGVYKHTTQLYNEQMRVPMIFYVPGLVPRRISDYVSTIDLGTTILDAVGIASPEGYAGVSLLPLLRGEDFKRPPVYGEQTLKQDSQFVTPDQYVHAESKKYMVVTQDGYKLIYNRDFYTFELFDLKNDPGEERNLYDGLPAKADELKSLLGQFIDIVLVSRPPDADESKYSRGYDQADED